MTAQINEVVSNLFYGGRLQSHVSCENRPLSTALSAYFAQTYDCPDGTTSVLFSVSGSTVLRRDGETSLINPHFVSHVYSLVTELLREVPLLQPRDILILSYYNWERTALSQIFRSSRLSDIQIKSVESSQGSENAVVVLSTTRPGGNFGVDRQRCNVGLSRAREFRIVVTDENLRNCDERRNPWAVVIEWHLNNDLVVRVEGNDAPCREQLGVFEGARDYHVFHPQPLEEGEDRDQKDQEDAYHER